DANGISRLKIYSGARSGDKWTNIQELPFNSDEYSCAHPTTTSDGDKMYFASDMEGGFGGMDIYVSYLEGGNKWSAPINLGPEINTEGDETFPFLANDGTLYFASDGHTGLGGYDVYFSNVERGIWDPVTNIGYPMNTRFDDFGITLDSAGVRGFIASNREGGKGLADIYSFTRRAVETEILVFDKLSGEGIEGIELVSECFPREVFITNVDGKINIDLPLDYSCTFKINSDQYGEKTVDVSTQGFQMRTTLFFEIPLEISELAFDVNGSVRDKKGNPMEGADVILLSSCGGASQTAKTDATGDYKFQIAPSCCYMVRVTAPGFFTSIDTFCTKGVTKPQTFESTVTMSKFWEENMLTNLPDDTSSIYVIDNIYYRLGAVQPIMGSSSGVEDLLTLLRNNPEVGVEVRSHTDSRGTTSDNFNLSTKRAEWIAEYLIENGIPEDHVSYKGFGESQLINGCSDGVSCSEREHKLNRRTEFRVIRMESN
ncbi:MAG: OmpA family protein, partial [Saprospiraceae bacterium]|nr:OmpA family protein [Saprospiraceae bacterium]